MIRALVVDDEPLARSRLLRLLSAHPDVSVVGEASSGNEAVAACLQHRPTLLFLDVDMPDGTGLEALERIRQTLPEALAPLAVFTTAHEEHAVKAFALEGLDYLLKPIEPATLDRALLRVRKRLWAQSPTPAPIAAPAPPPPAVSSGHLAAHRGGRVISLDLDDVACVEIEDTIAFAYTAEGRFRLNGTLGELLERLPSPPFIQVSRSAVVQLDHVKHLEPLGAGVWLASLKAPVEKSVRVARRRVKTLRELLGW
jgi:DNA-binding LytR/AlgR family response regulator